MERDELKIVGFFDDVRVLRIPEDGVAPGRSPLINLIGTNPLFVTKLSDNPFITVTKARTIASNLDCAVNF